MLHAVIMAGGAGTRFWPASRAATPKQLLDLAGEETMLQATVGRLGNLVPPERVLVVTNRALVEPIARQLPHVPREAIVGEPCKRDTAACIGLAAVLVLQKDPNAVMLVMPSDHVIRTSEQFQSAAAQAAAIVERHPRRIVTLGVRPTFPAEVFGYIERGAPLSGEDQGASRVTKFHEKPKAELARSYLAKGNYYWNAGIFVWRADTILAALARFAPAIHGRLMAIQAALGGPEAQAVLEREFAAIVPKSIDFAVMEHYDDVAVIEAPFAWDDLGSWQSIARLRGADEQGNTIVGKHLGVRTTNSIVRGSDEHLIVTLGVSDCLVVHAGDATLVANRHDEEAIREVVKLLQEKGWSEYL